MTFEQHIANALNGAATTADKLAQLISETEAAIAAAALAAAAARTKALELTADPEQVLAVQRKAELTHARLTAALPKLLRRHQQAANAEEYAEWVAQFDPLLPKHKAAAERLRAIYQQVVAELIPALVEAKQIDAEVHRVANLKPYYNWNSNNDNRTLPTVEAAARGLPAVAAEFSLMTMKLPAFDAPNLLAWPPPETPLALQVIGGMLPIGGDARQFSGDWWRVRQQQAADARAKAQREQQERQAEIDANYHGPRWWERTGS
jgi:hypothetical protein